MRLRGTVSFRFAGVTTRRSASVSIKEQTRDSQCILQRAAVSFDGARVPCRPRSLALLCGQKSGFSAGPAALHSRFPVQRSRGVAARGATEARARAREMCPHDP